MQIPNTKINYFFNKDSDSIIVKSNTIEHAYLAILNNDLDASELIFKKIDSPRAKWGVVLVSILKGYFYIYPSYFQVRNFLEIDLEFLLKNEKIDYVELLLGALDPLCKINQEVYKYVARVFLVNNLNKVALKYMNKSKKVYYNDAELHFMLAKYFFLNNDYEQAMFYLFECLKLIPEYYPALVLRKKIAESQV